MVDIAFTLSGTGEYYAISPGVKFTDEDAVIQIDSDEIIEGTLIVEQGNVALTWDGMQNKKPPPHPEWLF